jgi:bacillolysin
MTIFHRSLHFCLAVALLLISGSFPPQALFAATPDDSLDSLRAQLDNNARISYHSGTGKVRFVGTEPSRPIRQPGPTLGIVPPEHAARNFLATYGPLFGLSDPAQELVVTREKTADAARQFVRFQQVYQNIPVFGGEMVVQVNAQNDVLSVNGEILPALALDVSPQIDSATATQTAISATAKWHEVDAASLKASEAALWIYDPVLVGPYDGATRLVWRIEVTAEALLPIDELILVDAQRGSIALHFNQVHTAKDRRTHDGNDGATLPGTLVCDESSPTCAAGDADAIAAHVNAGDTYDFYLAHHGRDSVDDAGMSLISTVHHCPSPGLCPYANAFWNDTLDQMVYGSGYALGDDVVAHELTHGVTDQESQLFYYYQSGAINESFSDVWGEFVDLTNNHGDDSPGVRWLMGEDLGIGAIRSMEDPTLFGDPDRMTSANYHTLATDNGGVHFNSGINNKAAYLMTDGGTFNGHTVTGLGIDKVAAIYYEVQTNLAVSGSDYADLYDLLYQACLNRVGFDAITLDDCQQVRNATDAVEMNLQPIAGFNEDAPFCAANEVVQTVFLDDLEAGADGWNPGSLSGTSRWGYDSTYGPFAHSGEHFLYADDFPATGSDSFIAMAESVTLPAEAYLHFAHAYGFEGPDYDGGVLEYSTNNGGTWQDAGSLFDFNGYDGPIFTGFSNPLSGRMAFLSDSHGYISSRLNLESLAGEDVRFRWRMGIDSDVYDWGWWLDDVHIFTCAPSHTLNVTTSGSAEGTVTSSPTGILCGIECSKDFASGTPITLTATAAAGGRFAGWTGACTGSGTCQFTLDSDKSVDARFEACFTLSLTRSGSGSTPTATPTNSSGCAVGGYVAGESISLAAAPDTGWAVSGWSGTANDASLAISNTLTMPAGNHAASVLYAIQQYTLTVTKSGSGSGSVTSDPAGITCGNDCSEIYNSGTPATLLATADANARFNGWEGLCTGTAACIITLNASTSINAVFERCFALSLTNTGSGSFPIAIPANSTGCAPGYYIAGESISLTVIPGENWLVSGWTGTGNDGSTAVTVSLTMPAGDHTVGVVYVEENPAVFIPFVQRAD